LKGDASIKTDAWSILESRERQKTDNGGRNLELLFRVCRQITPQDLRTLMPAYKCNNWQRNHVMFQNKFEAAMNLLDALERKRRRN
jgi:hypothetical protein